MIAGYKRGDSWAQKEIYETFATVMPSLCVRYVKNKTNAEDILQDGFVKVFTQADYPKKSIRTSLIFLYFYPLKFPNGHH